MKSKKLNILYDATLLREFFNKNSSRSGIFWVAYNILIELAKNENFNVYLYSSNIDEYLKLKNILLNNKTTLKNCKLFYNVSLLREILIFLKEKKHHYKSKKKKIKKFFINIVINFYKIFLDFIYFFKKENNNISLKNINVFFSPIFLVPEEIQQYKNIQCYTVLHDTIPLIFSEYYPDIQAGNSWFLDLINSNFNKDNRSHFFAVSKCTKNDFIKYVPSINANKITIMPIATSQIFYPEKNEEKLNKILNKYNVSQNQRGKYIFSLCTLEPRKNLVFTIKCFIKFIKENNINDLYFYLGGGHWDYFMEILEKEIDNLNEYKDKIVKLGYVDDEDLNILYNHSLFFTYISLYEGFGMPPLEAMSCGVPVITSNTSSIPEVVGDSAIMIDPKDEKVCINAMKDLYYNENLRNELSIKGLEQAKKFSWDKTTNIIKKQFISI